MLGSLEQEIETFKKKEVFSLSEMKNNTEKLEKLTAILDAAFFELDVRETSTLS